MEFIDFSKGIVLLYGEAATGKTTIAMQLGRNVAKNKRVVFIDSENGFSLERFKQIAGEDYKKYLDKIFLLLVKDFKEQTKAVLGLEKLKNVGLVVVDTIGSQYRVSVRENYAEANYQFDKQLKMLQELTRRNIAVLITNQVYANLEERGMQKEVKSVGGSMVRNWAGCIIQLRKEPRMMVMEKPFRKEKMFEITAAGVELI